MLIARLSILRKSGTTSYLQLIPWAASRRAFSSHWVTPQSNWERLRDGILALGRSGKVSSETAVAYGRKFEVDGILTGPSERSATVRRVWIIRTGEDFPRLVTVFPR